MESRSHTFTTFLPNRDAAFRPCSWQSKLGFGELGQSRMARDESVIRISYAPEGQWKLAGGASHWSTYQNHLRPGRGGGSLDRISSAAHRIPHHQALPAPLPVRLIPRIDIRWLAPPSKFRSPSGVMSLLDPVPFGNDPGAGDDPARRTRQGASTGARHSPVSGEQPPNHHGAQQANPRNPVGQRLPAPHHACATSARLTGPIVPPCTNSAGVKRCRRSGLPCAR